MKSVNWNALPLLVAILTASAGCRSPSAHDDRIVIGHSACLSGKYAKEGEQAVAGIRACVEWINATHGGVRIDGQPRPLDYLYYDCESNRETVGSLLERLITVDHVDATLAPYTSGLTLAGAGRGEVRNALSRSRRGER